MRRPTSLPGLLFEVARIQVRRAPARWLLAPAALVSALGLAVFHGDCPCASERAAGRHAPLASPALGQCEGSHVLCVNDATCGGARCVTTETVPAALASEVSPSASVAWFPTLVSNGEGWAVAWVDHRHEKPELYLQRLGATGQRVGAAVRLTRSDALNAWPQLAWSGQGYGLTWTRARDRDFDTYFTRLNTEGTPVGEPVRVTPGEGVNLVSQMVWNGREYALAWYHLSRSATPSIRLARFNAEGGRVGAERTLRGDVFPVGGFGFAGTPRGYALAWNNLRLPTERTTTSLLLTDPEGAGGRTVEVSRNDELCAAASLAWDERTYGVVWEDGLDLEEERASLAFASATESGPAARRRVLTPRTTLAAQPSLRWTGSEYGLAWADNRNGRIGVRFARLDREGKLLGEVVNITTRSDAAQPSLVWNGREFGLSWTDTRGRDLGVYFTRLTPRGGRVGDDVRVSAGGE